MEYKNIKELEAKINSIFSSIRATEKNIAYEMPEEGVYELVGLSPKGEILRGRLFEVCLEFAREKWGEKPGDPKGLHEKNFPYSLELLYCLDKCLCEYNEECKVEFIGYFSNQMAYSVRKTKKKEEKKSANNGMTKTVCDKTISKVLWVMKKYGIVEIGDSELPKKLAEYYDVPAEKAYEMVQKYYGSKVVRLSTPVCNFQKDKHPYIDIDEQIFNKPEQENQRIEKMATIESYYLERKSGQKNKGFVCAFVVLDWILSLSEDAFAVSLEKYQFLKVNSDLLKKLYSETRSVPREFSQKEFCQYAGMDETKFSEIKKKLKAYLNNYKAE